MDFHDVYKVTRPYSSTLNNLVNKGKVSNINPFCKKLANVHTKEALIALPPNFFFKILVIKSVLLDALYSCNKNYQNKYKDCNYIYAKFLTFIIAKKRIRTQKIKYTSHPMLYTTPILQRIY